MLDALTICPTKPGDQPLAGLPALVDSIGSVTFWARLIEFLSEAAGGEHCVVWKLSNEQMHKVGAASWNGADQAQRRLQQYAEPKFWRRDPALAMARRHATSADSIMVRMDPRYVSDTLIREKLYGEDHICERVVLCKLLPGTTLGLSVVRGEDQGPFSALQLEALRTTAEVLLSVLGKHAQIVAMRHGYNPVSELNLSDIERVLQQSASRLSKREAQVCARLICGRPMSAIAGELAVSAETVETYRKRAYERLGVSSKQELLLRYLGYC
ncbi:MAG TPA: helix-turn-helix transcriptional regulator [Burkholderiaceae bacterium]|nr:helix-turn-helix transcriptional regulator [Burkholderiaceae bacterium]